MSDDEVERSAEFCFTQWAESFGLNRATTGILIKEACATKEILQILSPFAVNKLGLSIGQGIAFRKGLKALGNTIGGKQTDATTPNPLENGSKRRRGGETDGDSHPPSGQRFREGIEQDMERELDDYLKGDGTGDGTDPEEVIGNTKQGAYGSDPRINLVIRSQKKKAQKISSFLPDAVTKRTAAKGRDKMALVQGPDGKLTVKTDEDVPGYLTLSEWAAANLRLMQHLLDSGELARGDIEFYNAYSLMIFEYVEHYEWSSILAFDGRYRELQAHTGFPWGTPNRGLEVSSLVPRVRKERQADRGRSKNTQRGERRGPCRIFAREGSCPYGEKCIFSHKQGRPEPTKNGLDQGQHGEH